MDLGIAISTDAVASGPYMTSGDLIGGIEAARDLGYRGVELSLRDSGALDRGGIVAALERTGMRAFSIATGLSCGLDGFCLLSEHAERRDRAVERMRVHIDFARELGCPVIIGGIRGRILATGERFREAAEAGKAAIGRCLEHAGRAGVSMLLEPINRYESSLINSLAEGIHLIQELGASGVKLLADTYHMNIEEPSIEASILEAGSLLGYLHVADSNRLAPGWGHIDFGSVLRTLRKIGSAIDVVVEVLPIPDGRAAAAQAIRHLERR